MKFTNSRRAATITACWSTIQTPGPRPRSTRLTPTRCSRRSRRTGWTLTHILITHHHGDHTAGNRRLKAATGCIIVGPKVEAGSIPAIDVEVSEGDSVAVGNSNALVIETPGHTRGHISYLFPDDGIVFVGDTLFSVGCGKLLEGDAKMMWRSLQKLMALPPETQLYCGHEYTRANTKFALTVEPGNAALQARAVEAEELAKKKEPALPTTIAKELATNPFLRPSSPEIQKRLGMEGRELWEIFGETRRRKDRF